MSRSALALLLLFAPGAALEAQSPASDRGGQPLRAPAPAWTGSWSALTPFADLPRETPGPPAHVQLLASPPTPAGLFWTAGNPAGLALDVTRAYGHLELRRFDERGPHRRPLEGAGIRSVDLSGLRWQPLAGGSALAGRVSASRAETGAGSYSPAITRHGSDPFVLTDTTATAMHHVRVQLDGAYGVARHPWIAGLALGVHVADDRSVASRLPRLARAANWGVAAGAGRSFAGERLSAALYGRLTGGVESARILASPAVVAVIYPLAGYAEPDPLPVTNAVYSQHVESTVRVMGLALGGRHGDVTWSGFVERGDRAHRHLRVRRADEKGDRWEAAGWRGGAAAALPLFGALRAALYGTYHVLDGDAFRRDLEGSIFRAHESLLDVGAEVRHASAGPWSAAARVSLRREHRARRDFIVQVGSLVETWQGAVAIEIARTIAPGLSVSAAAGAVFGATAARLPDPVAMGPVYQRLVAPELAAYTGTSRPAAGSVTIRRQFGPVALLLSTEAWWRSAAPDAPPLATANLDAPTSWSFSLGAVWDR